MRGIFEAYTRSRGLLAIARELNARGVLPPDSGAARSRAWLKSALSVLLHNPISQGDVVWSRARYRELGKKRGKRAVPEAELVVSRDAVPAIVSREMWEAVQHRGGRRFGMGRPWHRSYVLSGLIECAHCGKRFQAQRQYRGRCRRTTSAAATWRAAETSARRRVSRSRISTTPCPMGSRSAWSASWTRRSSAGASTRCFPGRPGHRARRGDVHGQAGLRETERKTARAGLVGEMIASLANVREVLEAGEPEARKAVVRSFLAGIRVDRAAGRAVLG